VTPLYNDLQALNGRLIVFRDVTDRKEVEKNLRRAMDRLQTQLIEIGTLQSQLREQAIRDALTNVFNRVISRKRSNANWRAQNGRAIPCASS
jgi:hypothetical protein